jgi:hypothetical protein
MGRASPIVTSTNAGELSPLLAGRVDFEKYPNGATICENFLLSVQGPAIRRGGTRFVHEVKNSAAGRPLLQVFEYSVTQAYQVEFGDQYVRFYTWDAVTKVRGIIESSPGVPYEIATPYTIANLYNTDGTPRLQFTQSGDFLYIASPDYQQRILKRLTATTFELDLFQSKGGPWKSLNDTTTTVYASAATGTGITLTASSAIFQAGHVGSLFYLESKNLNAIPAWEVSKAITVGAERRSDSKTYIAQNSATTGTNRPVHTEGALNDGDNGVLWLYEDPGYGWVRITGFTSGTVVTADVIQQLPSQVVSSGNATTRWAYAEWSAVEGWPYAVAFFRDRLWWGRKRQAWSSVTSDYEDYSPKSFGQVTDDMAITVNLASGKLNDIQWLAPDRDLVAGTAGGEFAIGDLANGDPLGPANVRARAMSQFGSRAVVPVKNVDALLFFKRSGLEARETSYDFGSDAYKSSNATVLAEHVTKSGVVQCVFASEPAPIVWCIRADGALIGFTWNPEQSVRGWHRHPVGGGDAFVESISVMPAAEGDRSEVWLIVRRTVNGVVRRYVEYMERGFRIGDPQSSQFYLDCGATYNGSPTTTITGLGYLEGMTVSVLSDGAPHPDRVVTSGSITLQRPGSIVQIGLSCPARWRSMRIEGGANDGTSQGKTKRAHKVTWRLDNTGGGRFGVLVDGKSLDNFQFRKASDPMDQPVPLFTGDKTVDWPNGYDTDAYYGFEIDQPVAATIVAVMPIITVQDGR